MLGLLKPCLTCGELTANESRCDEHEAEVNARAKAAHERTRTRASFSERGYDRSWVLLSKRARRMQRYCSDCGTTERLSTDHTPAAWAAQAAGQRITLEMVDVVCLPCNNKRGSSRPGTPRYEKWENSWHE